MRLHIPTCFTLCLCLILYSDGASVTWHEPLPVRTVSNAGDDPNPAKEELFEGYPASLRWSFSFTSVTVFAVSIMFDTDHLAISGPKGSDARVEDAFKDRFNFTWISRRLTLTIFNVTAAYDESNGEFSCEIITSLGAWIRKIKVKIVDKPVNVQLTSSATDNKACTGDMISFTCSAVADPNITYQLYENDTAIEDVSRVGMWKRNMPTGGVFMYKCVAKNSVGSGVSSYVMVIVDGGLCEKPCTDGRSCRKFRVKNVCICPEGETRKDCKDEAELKENVVVGLMIKREVKQVYEDLENPETKTLVEEIKTNTMIEFQGTGLASVKVLKLRPGSILADLELTFNTSVDQSCVDALLTQATKAGKLGDMGIEDVVVGRLFPDTSKKDCGMFFEGEDCKKAKPGLIVLCVVGGVTVLAIIVVRICCLHKKNSYDPYEGIVEYAESEV